MKGKCKVVWGNGDIIPFILNLGSIGTGMAKFSPRPL